MGYLRLLLVLFLASVPLQAAELETAVAERRVLVREQVVDGVVEAVNRSTVSSQTNGRIMSIAFDVDDYVEKGEVILRLRDTEQRARLEAAQAALAEARALLDQNRKEYNRQKDLYERKLVPKAAFDRAGADLKASEARVTAARARIQEAREQLENTIVRAPYSGIVVERHVEVGETANPGTPLMTGLSLDHLRVVASLPQSHAQAVRDRGEAAIVLPDTGERVAAERLVVFPYADARTHTFTVRAELPEATPGLYPGMLVKVAFGVGSQERIVIPRKALVHRGEVSGVYRIAGDGRLSFQQVRVGVSVGADVEILAGLSEGDRVALDPVGAAVELKRQRGV